MKRSRNKRNWTVAAVCLMLCFAAGLLTACTYGNNPLIGTWRRVEGDGYWIQPHKEYGYIEYSFSKIGDLAVSFYDSSGGHIVTYDTAYFYKENSLGDGIDYVIEGDKLTIHYSDGTYESLLRTHSD